MKNHKKWIIVDLDGTICDCAHRLDMAKDGRWEDFHEAFHYVDYTVLALDESFHTEGFFRREAHLARQLLGASARAPRQLQLGL